LHLYVTLVDFGSALATYLYATTYAQHTLLVTWTRGFYLNYCLFLVVAK